MAPSTRSHQHGRRFSACALAALTREESRGGHTREDMPTPEDEYWGKTLNIIWMEEGEIKIRQEPVEEMRETFKMRSRRSKP